MNEMMQTRTPEVIAAEINTIKAQAREVYVRSAVEIGRRLYEAKSSVPHGEWGRWLETNVDYSERTAQNLMAVYEEYGRKGNAQALTGLTFTKAVQLLRLDGETRAELMETEDVAAMSTRELEMKIKQLNEEIKERQVTLDQLLAQDEEESTLKAEMAELRGELEAANARAEDAVTRANQTAAANAALRGELDAEKERKKPETVIEQIEVTPPEVEEELRNLREQVKTAPSREVILLRNAYETLIAQFKEVEGMIAELDKTQPEEAERYRRAVATAAEHMRQRLTA